jgi:hypothetical protein
MRPLVSSCLFLGKDMESLLSNLNVYIVFLINNVYFNKAQRDATQSTQDVFKKPLIHRERTQI